MKHFFFSLMTGVMLFNPVLLAQKDGGPAPEFSAAKMEVNYGDVSFKGDGNREFTFKNSGQAPLLISNARGTCGCTVPEWPKEPIRPGETGVLRIKYDTSRPGPIDKSVIITTNEVESTDAVGNITYKQHTIAVKGSVRPAPNSDGLPTRNPGSIPTE
jgi:hypothetical protein